MEKKETKVNYETPEVEVVESEMLKAIAASGEPVDDCPDDCLENS